MIFGTTLNGKWFSWHELKSYCEKLESEYNNMRTELDTEKRKRFELEADFATEKNKRVEYERSNKNTCRDLAVLKKENIAFRAALAEKNNTIRKLQQQLSALPQRNSQGRFIKRRPADSQKSIPLGEGVDTKKGKE